MYYSNTEEDHVSVNNSSNFEYFNRQDLNYENNHQKVKVSIKNVVKTEDVEQINADWNLVPEMSSNDNDNNIIIPPSNNDEISTMNLDTSFIKCEIKNEIEEIPASEDKIWTNLNPFLSKFFLQSVSCFLYLLAVSFTDLA